MYIELYTMTWTAVRGGGGLDAETLYPTHGRRPYGTCSDVTKIVFSLLMSSSSGGLGRPPAVRKKAARSP